MMRNNYCLVLLFCIHQKTKIDSFSFQKALSINLIEFQIDLDAYIHD